MSTYLLFWKIIFLSAKKALVLIVDNVTNLSSSQVDYIKAMFVLQVNTNDQMLVMYIASLIRSVIALHNLINNKLTNKEAEKEVKKEDVKEKKDDKTEKKEEVKAK